MYFGFQSFDFPAESVEGRSLSGFGPPALQILPSCLEGGNLMMQRIASCTELVALALLFDAASVRRLLAPSTVRSSQ
jgi:hypothetical protein